MPLSMKSEIAAFDIQHVTTLRTGTVYKLDGYAADAIVVKSQAGNVTADSFQASKRAMKQVDREGGAAKLLSNTERQALKAFAQLSATVSAQMTGNRMAVYANTQGAPTWAEEILDNIDSTLWYKMPLQNVSDLGDALDKRMQGTPDKTLLTEFQSALVATGGLETLGKIVACDLFNGNTDRFFPGRGSSVTYGSTTLTFKVLVNITNVFIGGTGTSRSITGMDFFDPNAPFRAFERTINAIKSDYDITNWSGDYLTSGSKRRAFCKDIIADLNLILSGGRSIAKSESVFARKKSWLPEGATDRLERGMVAGGRAIREGLTQKYANANNKPAGLDSRLTALAKL